MKLYGVIFWISFNYLKEILTSRIHSMMLSVSIPIVFDYALTSLSLASQGVSGDDSLTIEYDVHDQQIIRSIDGTLSSNFSKGFYLYANCRFSLLLVSTAMISFLNISGGQLASVNSANYSDIIDAIQFRYDGNSISDAIDSIVEHKL